MRAHRHINPPNNDPPLCHSETTLQWTYIIGSTEGKDEAHAICGTRDCRHCGALRWRAVTDDSPRDSQRRETKNEMKEVLNVANARGRVLPARLIYSQSFGSGSRV